MALVSEASVELKEVSFGAFLLSKLYAVLLLAIDLLALLLLLQVVRIHGVLVETVGIAGVISINKLGSLLCNSSLGEDFEDLGHKSELISILRADGHGDLVGVGTHLNLKSLLVGVANKGTQENLRRKERQDFCASGAINVVNLDFSVFVQVDNPSIGLVGSLGGLVVDLSVAL